MFFFIFFERSVGVLGIEPQDAPFHSTVDDKYLSNNKMRFKLQTINPLDSFFPGIVELVETPIIHYTNFPNLGNRVRI